MDRTHARSRPAAGQGAHGRAVHHQPQVLWPGVLATISRQWVIAIERHWMWQSASAVMHSRVLWLKLSNLPPPISKSRANPGRASQYSVRSSLNARGSPRAPTAALSLLAGATRRDRFALKPPPSRPGISWCRLCPGRRTQARLNRRDCAALPGRAASQNPCGL